MSTRSKYHKQNVDAPLHNNEQEIRVSNKGQAKFFVEKAL